MTSTEFCDDDFKAVLFENGQNPRIKVEPMYFKSGFSPCAQVFGRKAVLTRLLKALAFLPDHYGFLVWDVYRSRRVQANLFNWMRVEVQNRYPHLSDTENYAETQKYMSAPSRVGEDYCPPHLSGGAIDLTLYDTRTDTGLEMGTVFDDCTERAHSDYFDTKAALLPEELRIREARQILRAAMENVGFTAYQYEWWHFDTGNIFWSRKLNRPAVFGPLFGDLEWPDDGHGSVGARG
ncbi:M15 family metallopeptidase [Legionella sp. CNM-4043-24]|uniref:M15 family metallopeptidase n=1 Tax=Legionella sp. CNM-4043-24 TaxID=3421646 RepID=UPI00403B0B68